MHPIVEELLKRKRIMQHTPEWYAARGVRLTASDVPAVLGHSPYSSRSEVLKRKTGQRKSTFNNFACAHGNKYEAVAARAYTQVTGIQCVTEDIGLVCHPQYDHFAASPDRVAIEYPILIEIKCPFKRPIEVGRIPVQYVDQVEFQMAVTGLPIVHFVQFKPATLCNRGAIDITEKPRDPTWWDANYSALQSFIEEVQSYPPKPRFRRLTLCRDGTLAETNEEREVGMAPVPSPAEPPIDLDRYDITYQKIENEK